LVFQGDNTSGIESSQDINRIKAQHKRRRKPDWGV